ncbi:hypothetical protein B0I35DRAFT_151162 [Stachybotrys elegans]|uniref:Uncharacterized protein n=1 Tax=Stachybotrys elegans TaxID=80388 RepID=A0A8K0SEV5_9HYPO|nr:hypothetical protein B0I35DRAFT_151162 [Stachybotrys elegans]
MTFHCSSVRKLYIADFQSIRWGSNMPHHSPAERLSNDEANPRPKHVMAASREGHDQHPISLDGFIYSKDADLGQRVSTMVNIPLASVEGFTFFKENVVDNLTIMETIRSYLQCESIGFGLYRTLGPVPGAYSFRKSNPDSPAESIVVHLLENNTKIAIWKASHRVKVPFSKGDIGLWETAPSNLEAAGSERDEQTFENGGYCIRDTRVFMEVLAGKAFTFAIAKRDVVRGWKPMKLDQSLKPTIRQIQTPAFEVHATYHDAHGGEYID